MSVPLSPSGVESRSPSYGNTNELHSQASAWNKSKMVWQWLFNSKGSVCAPVDPYACVFCTHTHTLVKILYLLRSSHWSVQPLSSSSSSTNSNNIFLLVLSFQTHFFFSCHPSPWTWPSPDLGPYLFFKNLSSSRTLPTHSLAVKDQAGLEHGEESRLESALVLNPSATQVGPRVWCQPS